MRRSLPGLLAVAVAVVLCACARLEPVSTARELASKPVGQEKEPLEKKPGLEDIPDMIGSIAVDSILPAAHPSSFEIEDILMRCPIPPDKKILTTVLSKTPAFRALLLQTNVDLRPRYNRKHDEIIQVYKGKGIFVLGRDRYVAKPGQIFIVPRKMIYRLQNTGEKPFVAVVIEIPPAEGWGDTIYVRKAPE